jgi:hypothetical protein
MIRSAIASLMLAGSAMAVPAPAHGQPVQYQFTPPPPIVPLPSWQPPSYPTIPGVAPPVPAPRRSGVVPYHVTPPVGPPGSRSAPYVYTQRGRAIAVPPPAPGRDTFGDSVSRCAHAGASAGLGPNQLGAFMGRCVN